MELKRKAYELLKNWKSTSQGESALLIEGARRVGKSFLAETFAKQEYKSYLLIDFSIVDKNVLDIFENNSHNLDALYQYLSVYYDTVFHERDTLIIFDEIQFYPKVRSLIKHFVKDGRYDFIETGSLISLKQNIKDILIPSEEEVITLYPLDYEEFLWAMKDNISIPLIKEHFDKRKPLGEAIHKKMMHRFKEYILVGGMPQAILKYIETKDFYETDKVKRRILKLYRDDVSKFAHGYEYKVLSIFDKIPSQLSKHEKKFTLASLEKNARLRTYEESFIWLSEAMITNMCFNSTDPNVGFGLSKDRMTLKCYMMDTGLLISHAFKDNSATSDNIYKAILFDKLEINEGMIMENAVAQALRTNGHDLYFYSKYEKGNSENTLEIDFILKEETLTKAKVSAVEVKSGKGYAYSSLEKYKKKFSSRINHCYILHTKDIKQEKGYTFLPIYMAMFL